VPAAVLALYVARGVAWVALARKLRRDTLHPANCTQAILWLGLLTNFALDGAICWAALRHGGPWCE
jgi:hypothetical protein